MRCRPTSRPTSDSCGARTSAPRSPTSRTAGGPSTGSSAGGRASTTCAATTSGGYSRTSSTRAGLNFSFTNNVRFDGNVNREMERFGGINFFKTRFRYRWINSASRRFPSVWDRAAATRSTTTRSVRTWAATSAGTGSSTCASFPAGRRGSMSTRTALSTSPAATRWCST